MSRGRLKVICAAALFLCAFPLLGASEYTMHLVIMTCVNIMLGLSFSLLYSAGLITIGEAGFWAVGAYTSALLVMNGGLSFWLALPISGAAAGLVGACVGAVIVRTPGVAFIIQTMVVNMILVQVFGHFDVFGGWAGLLDIPSPGRLGPVDFTSKTASYYLVLVLLSANLLAYYALYTSRIGRAWSAIKLNGRLAESLGVDLFRYRLAAFVVSSAGAGLAGSFYAHYFQTLEPGMFTVFKSIYVQIYSILGGLDSYLLGPVVGAAIMTFVPELLREGRDFEPILTGTVLIVLVIFLPGGILGLPSRLRPLFSAARARVAGKREEKA